MTECKPGKEHHWIIYNQKTGEDTVSCVWCNEEQRASDYIIKLNLQLAELKKAAQGERG